MAHQEHFTVCIRKRCLPLAAATPAKSTGTPAKAPNTPAAKLGGPLLSHAADLTCDPFTVTINEVGKTSVRRTYDAVFSDGALTSNVYAGNGSHVVGGFLAGVNGAILACTYRSARREFVLFPRPSVLIVF